MHLNIIVIIDYCTDHSFAIKKNVFNLNICVFREQARFHLNFNIQFDLCQKKTCSNIETIISEIKYSSLFILYIEFGVFKLCNKR